MSGSTVSQPKTSPADSKKEMQNFLAGGAAAAKVTLVKPAQSEETVQQEPMAESNMSEKLSYARPKVGRASAGSVAQESKPASMAREEGKPMELPPIPRDLAAVTSTRPWDVKFALLLVTLFVAVNLGLIMLLHTSHKTPQHMANETAATKTEKPVAEKTMAPAIPAPAAPAVPAAATASSETLAVPPALPVAPQAAAPVLTPPAVASAPVTTIVPPAAPVAETPAPAAPVATPAAAAPAAATASAAPASAASPAASSQDLLSIIGKN